MTLLTVCLHQDILCFDSENISMVDLFLGVSTSLLNRNLRLPKPEPFYLSSNSLTTTLQCQQVCWLNSFLFGIYVGTYKLLLIMMSLYECCKTLIIILYYLLSSSVNISFILNELSCTLLKNTLVFNN